MSEARSTKANRRSFLRAGLATSGAALTALACGDKAGTPVTTPVALPQEPAAPAVPLALQDLSPRNFVVHGVSPLTLETRRDRFGTSVVTPTDRFFIRNNLPLPPRSIMTRPDEWEVQFTGVTEPRTVSVRELKTWGVETLAMVVQCSGNGRQFFEHETSGSQWGVGAAACALWTGVPLKTVVEKLGGPVDGLGFLTSTGGEELPEGVDALSVAVERSIPREKALDDCLLAWELNGEPIPITHGGPLRLIVPGYYGCNQIKYVKQMAFTENETAANIMSSGYRFRPIGESGAAEQPSMWKMNTKSWITSPSSERAVARGTVQVTGVAFSGGNGVGGVEVSMDGGENWQAAELFGPDLGPHAWRQFRLPLDLPLGTHRLVSRATDQAGTGQPELRVENHRGYGHNGWRDLGVEFNVVQGPIAHEEEAEEAWAIDVSGPEPGTLELSEDEQAGRELFLSGATPPCGTCHTLSEAGSNAVVGPNLNALVPEQHQIENALANGVGAMPSYGGTLSEEQTRQLTAYIRAVVTAR